jgi:hypothetical protein
MTRYIFLIEKKNIYLYLWQEKMSLSFYFLVLKKIKDKNYDNII